MTTRNLLVASLILFGAGYSALGAGLLVFTAASALVVAFGGYSDDDE
jgi:hypothetical protein